MTFLIILFILNLWSKKSLLSLAIGLEVAIMMIMLMSLFTPMSKYYTFTILVLAVSEAVVILSLIMKISSTKKFLSMKSLNLV